MDVRKWWEDDRQSWPYMSFASIQTKQRSDPDFCKSILTTSSRQTSLRDYRY